MSLPTGPKPISDKGQLAIPSELMRALNLRRGDRVYLQESDEFPGCLMVIPVEIFAQWWEAGRAQYRRQREEGVGEDAAGSENGTT